MLPPSPVPVTASPLPQPLCDRHTGTPACHQRRGLPNIGCCRSAQSAWPCSHPSIVRMGRAGSAPPLPCCPYFPLHQPSAVLCDNQERPSLWFCVILTVCLLHQPSAAGGRAGVWMLSHSLACSTCALTLAKSVPRRVTSTSCPCRVAFRVIDTGASGSVGTASPWGC